MSIQQSKKTSDLEKRLNLLRQQVYGKQEYKMPTQNTKNISGTKITTSDTTYLFQDLFKITILTSLALGIQVVLYFLLKNGVINLNFF